MMDTISNDFTEKQAAGKTVNERLWFSGLMRSYDDAVARNNINEMADILKRIHLDQESIEANIRFALGEK